MSPPSQKRNSLPKVLLIALLVAAVAVIVVAAGLLTHVQDFADRPADPGAGEIVVDIPKGQGFASVCRRLHSMGIVASAWKFRLLGRLEKQDANIKAGEYLLSAAMVPRDILHRLVSGRVRLYRLTIPEGFTLEQIAAAAGRTGLVSGAECLALAERPDVARDLNLPADRLEGYLFPDTYAFPRNVTCRDIVVAMVARFRQVFDERMRRRASEIGMSVHEVVTLASIIEKETGEPSERPLIASVFHNRLKRNMRLETDPTVIYGLSAFDGNLTRKHLKTPSPYNTYLNPGLPPGPIASPGAAALEAALYPAETAYLYFVARRDGTHQFSTSLKDHNRAVRRYQLRR
jgi:UPF0755 protein